MNRIGLCLWARLGAIVFGFAISIGVAHSATSGFLIGWGNRSDATILPDDVTNVVSACAGTGHSLWLRSDGTVRFQGDYPFQGAAAGASALSNVAAISLGYKHALALLSNGTVVAWGEDAAGDNALAAGISTATAIAAGGYFNLVVVGGKVIAWGDNRFGQLDVPSGLSNVVAVSASQTYNSAHCMALKSDGTVVAWGDSTFGQTAVPAGLSNVTAISAGWYHCVALKSDGTVVAWGGDNPGTGVAPAGLSNVVAISGGAWHTLALRRDRTIFSWASPWHPPEYFHVPESFTNAIAISAGEFHNLAVFADGAPRLLDVEQPTAVYAGSENSFWVTVAGVGPLSYQWRKDGVALTGKTNWLLYLSDVQPPDEGDYNVTVSNPFGSASTEPLPLTIVPAAVEIWKHPETTFTYEGSFATFEVLARGSLPISYQWYERISQTTAIPGATGPSLTVSNVTGLQTRYYFVVVSNAWSSGSITSRLATLTVRPAQLAISRQPRGDNVFIGASVTFTVGIDGVPPLYYQWRKNGVPLANETNPTLTLANVGTADAGVYSVVISNQVGSVTSADAALTVHSYSPPPTSPPGTVVNLSGALLPPELTNIIAIAAGRLNALAVHDNGTVELVPGGWILQGLSNVVAVAPGRFDSGYGLRADGTVARWSGGSAPEPISAAGVFGVVAIAGSDEGGVGLKSDGRVVSLDSGEFLSGISNVVAVAAGLALHANGSITVFARPPLLPPFQQYHPPSNAIAVAVGPGLLALTADGTVVEFGIPPTPVPAGLTNVVAISGGYRNALALKSDGTVIGWGRTNISQQIDNVSALAAGGRFSLVLTTNPPPPMLAAVRNGDQCELLAPVAVSGYVLECTEDPSQPYTPITVLTNANDLSGPNMGLILPPEGRTKLFRLRKL